MVYKIVYSDDLIIIETVLVHSAGSIWNWRLSVSIWSGGSIFSILIFRYDELR